MGAQRGPSSPTPPLPPARLSVELHEPGRPALQPGGREGRPRSPGGGRDGLAAPPGGGVGGGLGGASNSAGGKGAFSHTTPCSGEMLLGNLFFRPWRESC